MVINFSLNLLSYGTTPYVLWHTLETSLRESDLFAYVLGEIGFPSAHPRVKGHNHASPTTSIK
jgi:hypothetical protein